MSSRLADLLKAARHRRFVGREAELSVLSSALRGGELPFHVVFLYGNGGVGKTTLLGEFADRCARAETSMYWIDARNVEPSPDSFLNALRLAMGLTPPASPLEAMEARAGRHVVVIDTYETLAPLDAWLRDVFLPQLPEQALVILSGRNGPSPAWLADAGWQHLIRRLPLDNLSSEDGRIYLARREVPAEQHRAVLEFTRGHPLALSLVAELFAQRPDTQFQPAGTPDVIKALLEQLIQKAPGPAHRAALEACALVRVTTETLLAEIVAVPDAHELFDWLCGLSFMQIGRLGIFPHDLARDALVTDLRWRNPDWYGALHRRARAYYAARLQQTRGQEQQRVLFDYFYLHRDNPVVRPFFEWQETGSAAADRLVPGDVPLLVAMVAQHEGQQSAQLAAHWFSRQPGGVQVYRGADGLPAGFVALVALHDAGAEDFQIDPAARVAWQYLQRHAPLRSGEGATLFRFWMARDTYQGVSAVQTLVFGAAAQHYLTAPGLAYAFFPCAEPDFWTPALTYADVNRLPEADFEVDGRRYGVFGHDWRRVPPMAWLDVMAERELAATSQPAVSKTPARSEVLDESEFASAVRAALRSVGRSDALRENPLLRSRMVMERAGSNAGAAARVSALQALMKEAAETLRTSPRDAKCYRALYHTYLHPAPSQERAAEILDWPFSTFRRHLSTGVVRFTALLWRQEIEGPAH